MSDSNIPTAAQLAESRREHWHQTGTPLLTMEALLPWLQSSGLVLFAPRGQQFAPPAPTLVEAVLGASNPTPSLTDREPARSLLGRMVAEGTALPLNLLGAPGTTADEPDFVVATATFAYLFTLRGDKSYKQLPSAAGPFKVSPLAVNTYALLLESGARSAADLANELGKGLTEAAVLRGLSELWQHLRVFPVAQADGTTLWELATTRFTKAMKAGANAGQPAALSALITLYLGQAVLATEDDVELFLSPLAPRSRVRDVVRALTAARELDTVVVEGKHCLHVAGDLPVFAPAAVATAEAADFSGQLEGEGRIKKFAGGPPKPAFGRAKPFSNDRERRPFNRNDKDRGGSIRRPAASRNTDRPAFDRPWDEERNRRSGRAGASPGSARSSAEQPEFQDIDLDAGSAPRDAAEAPAERTRPPRPAFGRPDGKKPFGERRAPFGSRDRPSSGGRSRPPTGDRAPRKSFGDRPAFSRDRRDARPPQPGGGDRPAYGRRREEGDKDARPFRPQGERPFRPRSSGPREEATGSDRPARPFRRFDDRGFRPTGPRPPAGDGRPIRPRGNGEEVKRPPRGKPFGGPKRFDSDDRQRGSDRAAHAEGEAGARPARPFRPRPSGAGGRAAGSDRSARPYQRFDARPGRPAKFSGRASSGPGDRSGGKRPFPAGQGGKPEGPFDKFKDNAKPWGKRPPKRKIKPEEDQAG